MGGHFAFTSEENREQGAPCRKRKSAVHVATTGTSATNVLPEVAPYTATAVLVPVPATEALGGTVATTAMAAPLVVRVVTTTVTVPLVVRAVTTATALRVVKAVTTVMVVPLVAKVVTTTAMVRPVVKVVTATALRV
ncbi:hypothetical protein, partial [Staphylococcus pasteuri]|uniref:hypothetical protein n=1 Tax=Staphylococcus pasteuri TaxID=45972 RepID=UPI003D05A9AC